MTNVRCFGGSKNDREDRYYDRRIVERYSHVEQVSDHNHCRRGSGVLYNILLRMGSCGELSEFDVYKAGHSGRRKCLFLRVDTTLQYGK
jgi:hypothetical protein